MVYKQKLARIGNSIGLTIPKTLRDQLNFKLGLEVYVQEDIKNKNIIISLEPIKEESIETNSEFYRLIKTVSNRYSKALQKLADN